MKFIADLQIHSRFSRATSKDITLQTLEKYARLKGVTLLGTGDFTHPKWLDELKENLIEDGSGILNSKTGMKFILQGEISNIFTQGGKGRRIHNLLLAPDFETVEQINKALLKKGRLDYDGRPMFGFSCIELVQMMRDISDDIEIIPAHAWTPWFGIFGSMSGFDSVKECFEDTAKHIHAIETGLSSDPPMNWRLSELDKYTLLSSSDAHSFWPWRLGREANVFEINPTYQDLLRAIRQKKGFIETIEVDPNYGKYHFDGHRACNVSMSPEESRRHNGICPVCKKPLTIGVLNRVEELADRPEGFIPKNAVGFKRLIPLSELLSAVIGRPVASKVVWAEYYKITTQFGSEFDVLLDVPADELLRCTQQNIAELIIKNRSGNLKIIPGYDGVYGQIDIGGKKAVAVTGEPKQKFKDKKSEDDTQKGDPKKAMHPKKLQKGLDEFW